MAFEKCPIFKNATIRWFNWMIFQKQFGPFSLAFYAVSLPVLSINLAEWLLLIYGEDTSATTLVINVYLTIEIFRATVKLRLIKVL